MKALKQFVKPSITKVLILLALMVFYWATFSYEGAQIEPIIMLWQNFAFYLIMPVFVIGSWLFDNLPPSWGDLIIVYGLGLLYLYLVSCCLVALGRRIRPHIPDIKIN